MEEQDHLWRKTVDYNMELFWVDGVEMLIEDYIRDESLEAYKKCMNLWSLHDRELDSMVQFLELLYAACI